MNEFFEFYLCLKRGMDATSRCCCEKSNKEQLKKGTVFEVSEGTISEMLNIMIKSALKRVNEFFEFYLCLKRGMDATSRCCCEKSNKEQLKKGTVFEVIGGTISEMS